VEHYKKAGENPSIAYAYADSSKRKYNKFEFLRFSEVITPRMTTDKAKAFLNRLSFHITNHFGRPIAIFGGIAATILLGQSILYLDLVKFKTCDHIYITYIHIGDTFNITTSR
jgi:hypothetical protein